MSSMSATVRALPDAAGGNGSPSASPDDLWDDGTPSHGELSSEVWHAFERAVEQTDVALSGAADPDELRRFLLALKRAVARVVAREHADLEGAPEGVPAVRALEHVRRTFIDELRATSTRDAQQAIHVLSALGHVQCILDRAATTAGAGKMVEREALGLTVEVAHDMRSPLAAILFLVDMLRSGRSGAISALQARQLGMVYGAALGLNQLACDVIDFVRGHDRLIDSQPVPFSVADVLNAVHDIVQPMAEEKGVSVRMITPVVDARLGRPAALNRILLNLASNAIKFAKDGQVIVAARELSATRVEFSVRDFGRGIPAAVVGQLFQPFRKPHDGTSYSFSSAGLGLSICHKLVAALGSELRVTTSPQQGTCFSFELELPTAGHETT